MNNDLISREALKEAISTSDKFACLSDTRLVPFYELPNAEEDYVPYVHLSDIVKAINNAPTVEPELVYVAKFTFDEDKLKELTDDIVERIKNGEIVVKDERPQGEWIGNAFDEHHCNRCGHPALWEEETDDYYEVQSRFCPNCGADMKGGAE